MVKILFNVKYLGENYERNRAIPISAVDNH
jgi:hypothetical protein